MTNRKPDYLAQRILADRLDVRDSSEIGNTLARRIKHLPPHEALVAIGGVVGYLVLLLEQIRDRSETGRQLIEGIRNSLVADIVANAFKED